jgi:ribosomal protein S12 methylthiotransferase accessory factor YcaO
MVVRADAAWPACSDPLSFTLLKPNQEKWLQRSLRWSRVCALRPGEQGALPEPRLTYIDRREARLVQHIDPDLVPDIDGVG